MIKKLGILVLFLSYFFCSSSGEIVVELSPANLTVNSSSVFNLDLVVKNVPADRKCGGFETTIKYDTSLLKLDNIQLSDVANNANLKDVDIDNGKISLAWFSNQPYGNFTIATLTFKALNPGNATVLLDDVSISDENGIKYKQVVIGNAIIMVNNMNNSNTLPNSYLLIDDFKYNSPVNGKLIINNTITPINKINGTISFKNIKILSLEPNNTVCSEFSYKKLISKGIYSGLAFYGENNYNFFLLEYGEIKNLSLIAYNVKENITYISGCIYINVSNNNSVLKLKFLSNKSIYKIKNEYKNNSWIGCYLYFNASPNRDGTFEIANIRITPNASLSLNDEYGVYLINVTAYSGNEKINLKKSSFKIEGALCNVPQDDTYSISIRSEHHYPHTNISFGDVKLISILYWNDSNPITNISGKIFINSSLLKMLDYNVSPKIKNIIKYKNFSIKGDYLFFDLTFTSPIKKSRILCIKVTPKINTDATTSISLTTSQNFTVSPLKVNIFKKDFSALPKYYDGIITNITFSFVPDDTYKNCSELSILTFKLDFSEYWDILMDIYQNDVKTNSSIIISKKTPTTTTEINNTIQIDTGYITGTSTTIKYGETPTSLYLRLVNVQYNITNISGDIFIENASLIKIDDVDIAKDIKDKLSCKNITFNESHIFFNFSFKEPINGTLPLLTFHIEAKIDTTVNTTIYLSNITAYSNTTKINLTIKNMTVKVVKRKTNHPPKLSVAFSILNNREVHFYAIGYDEDNDTLKYYWDFGDGSNSTDENPIHVYSNFSDYAVRCVVKDPMNGSDEVKFIINIKNVSPITYNLSNTHLYIDENESNNKTIYINISLNNPFPYAVSGYIDFENFVDYQVPKCQYQFELLPNETVNLTIPINVSKSTSIEWSVSYYLHYPKRFKNPKYQFLYYEWKFENKIEFKRKPKIIEYNYIREINLNNSNIILKLNKNKVVKDYIINKSIKLDAVPKKDVIYYCIASLVGFIVGMGLIRRVKF